MGFGASEKSTATSVQRGKLEKAMPRGIRLTSTLLAEMLLHLLTQVDVVWSAGDLKLKSDARKGLVLAS